MRALIAANWREVDAWLDVLLELPGEVRPAWLEARCAAPDLRHAVLALLDHEARGGERLDRLVAWVEQGASD